MNLTVTAPKRLPANAAVTLPSSKSISNRALILDALSGFKARVTNPSKANDTVVLQRLLKQRGGFLDAEDAGTVLRFAAVYFSMIDGEHVITGTERLMNRPMQPLLDALKRLGGKATFKTVAGKKSLLIRGGTLKGGEVTVDASESSQFVSALLLCGAAMPNGLVVKTQGNVVSEPYVDMTLGLLAEAGVAYSATGKRITITNQNVQPFKLKIESDWSSAAFFYSLLSCYESGSLLLKGLVTDSLQGDAVIGELMEVFGITSKQVVDGVWIEKKKMKTPTSITVDAKDFPDLVPALTVTAMCNDFEIKFKGVGHLRLKESNRIDALVATAAQLGAKARPNGNNGFTVSPLRDFVGTPPTIKTYDDHRMAMAFAALSSRYNSVVIENALVVKKSFPRYWSELKKLGFETSKS